MTNNRIAYISCLQILGAALVILYHSFHEYPGNYASLPPLLLFQSVRMPLFTFISGFLFMLSWQKPGRYSSVSSFISIKAQRLLLPFIVLQTLAFVPRAMMSKYADEAVNLSVDSFLHCLIHTPSMTIPYFWYLPMIFTLLTVCYLLLSAARRHPQYILAGGTAAAILLFLCFDGKEIEFMGLGRLTDLTIFFMLGMIYARMRSQTDRLLSHWWQGAIYVTIWIATFLLFDTTSRWMQLLLSITGLGFMLCLAHHLSRIPKLWKPLEGYNYYMYLLSWFTCVASQQFLHHFTHFPWWVYTSLAFLSSIILPTLIAKILERLAPTNVAARTAICMLGHNPQKYTKKIPPVNPRVASAPEGY